MAEPWNKDAWIKLALARQHIIAGRDGSIYRCQTNYLGERVKWKISLQVHKPTGRVYFNMTFAGKTKSVLVNRVVALRFIPNPDNLPEVNHIDGNKENNAVENLEWSNRSEQEKHAFRTGLKSGRGSSNSNSKLTAAQVVEIRSLENSGADVLAKVYGVKPGTIRAIIARKTWKHI